jgi:hypothetical protein
MAISITQSSQIECFHWLGVIGSARRRGKSFQIIRVNPILFFQVGRWACAPCKEPALCVTPIQNLPLQMLYTDQNLFRLRRMSLRVHYLRVCAIKFWSLICTAWVKSGRLWATLSTQKDFRRRGGQVSYQGNWWQLIPKSGAQFFRRTPEAHWRETVRAQLLGSGIFTLAMIFSLVFALSR